MLWAGVATLVALVQFFGAEIFASSTAGWRYPSFLGRHDLAALAALATSVAAASVVARRSRTAPARLVPVAAVGGVLGLVLAGSVTAAAGFAAGAVALALASRRQFAPSAGSSSLSQQWSAWSRWA